MDANRRRFVKGGVGAFLGTLGMPALRTFAQGTGALPAPQNSGVDHIVVVTMENRSFDHLLGWMPGANGKQAGLPYVDQSGASHLTHWLAPDYTGCGHPDPDHSYGPDRVAYNNGAMDGFLRAGSNDVYTVGYYAEGDIPFYASLAQSYMTCDNWFAAILGPTFPNRMFLRAAQTDRLDDSVGLSSLPTIFDRLSQRGVSHRYYFNNVPDLVNGAALLGFRVPTVIASPFTFGTGINPALYDHTAALKLIEWRWGLQPLTARDASSAINNPAASFNFASPVVRVPALPKVSPVFALPCFEGGVFSSSGVSAETYQQETPGKPNEFAILANLPATRQFMAHPQLQAATPSR